MSRFADGSVRVRWAAIGAAVAVALGGGAMQVVNATLSDGELAVYVPITPCRLFDTRPGGDNVGGRATPLSGTETWTVRVHGAQGQCNIPVGASAISMNTTVLNGNASSFLTVFPADKPKPLASSLNWSAGDGPTPNLLNVALSIDGQISLYNHAGTVDVIGDIVGYFEGHNHDTRVTRRSIAISPEELSESSLPAVIEEDFGLTWSFSNAGSAVLSLHRPLDFAGTGTVTLRMVFYPFSNPPAGSTVQFIAEPLSYNAGDLQPVGGTLVGSNAVSMMSGSAFRNYEARIEIDPSLLTKQWFYVELERSTTVPSAYTGSVRLIAMTMEYDAYVVAPGT